MNEDQFAEVLTQIIEASDDWWEYPHRIKNVRPFSEAGILTSNEGIEVTLTDGSQFQVMIIKAR